MSPGFILMLPKVFSLDQDLSTAVTLWSLRPVFMNRIDPPTGTRTMAGEKLLSAIETSTVPVGFCCGLPQPQSPAATHSAAMTRLFTCCAIIPYQNDCL